MNFYKVFKFFKLQSTSEIVTSWDFRRWTFDRILDGSVFGHCPKSERFWMF